MRSWILALVAAVAAFGALVAPDPAAACSLCLASQSEEVRYAFLWTTGFLSVLPLGLVGGVIWFLRRRAREIAERGRAPGGSLPVPVRGGAPAGVLSRASSSR